MADLTDEFVRGVFGDGKVTRHAISNGRARHENFTLCGAGGWCAEDDKATCPECRAWLDNAAQNAAEAAEEKRLAKFYGGDSDAVAVLERDLRDAGRKW